MEETSNEKKRRLLGQPYGTANGQLRKLLLFKFAKQLGLGSCHRCSVLIDDIEDFSIEHTVPWEGAVNPVETFFNLDTIAFSHLRCNSGAGLRHKGLRESTKHGIIRYDNGCRCEICVTAHSDKARNWKRKNNYRGINQSDRPFKRRKV
jgi:hypothetical protein